MTGHGGRPGGRKRPWAAAVPGSAAPAVAGLAADRGPGRSARLAPDAPGRQRLRDRRGASGLRQDRLRLRPVSAGPGHRVLHDPRPQGAGLAADHLPAARSGHRDLAGVAGAQRAALDRITLAEERARYASSPVASAGLQADVATVRRAVATSGRPGARWGAMVLPASTLALAWAALQNALDVFGWMDVITTGLRCRGRGGRSRPSSPGARKTCRPGGSG